MAVNGKTLFKWANLCTPESFGLWSGFMRGACSNCANRLRSRSDKLLSMGEAPLLDDNATAEKCAASGVLGVTWVHVWCKPTGRFRMLGRRQAAEYMLLCCSFRRQKPETFGRSGFHCRTRERDRMITAGGPVMHQVVV